MQDNEKKPALRFKGFTDPWEQRKLGELSCSFEYGLNAAAKEYDGQNKYLRITDIDDTSRQFVTTDITSPDINLTDADSYKLSDGDVLFARTGASVGKTYLYKKSDGLVYFAGFLIRAKIKESVSAGFIFQNTLTRSYERYIAITSQRSGQPGVNAQEYAEYQLMLPELFEQEKIAKLLEALDTLITLHQRKHEKLVNIKKSMLDKMFPKNGASVPEIRFKGFTDLWEQRKLGEICDFITKGATPTTYGFSWQPDGVPFFRNDSIKDNVFVFGEFSYISEAANEVLKRSEVHGNDILIAITGDIGKVGIIPDTVEKANINQHIARVRIRKEALPYFVYQYLASDDTQKEYQKIKTGLSMPQLSLEQVRDIVVKIPEFNEQGKIADCLRRIDTLITLHQRKLEKLQNIKKSCLEKMFV